MSTTPRSTNGCVYMAAQRLWRGLFTISCPTLTSLAFAMPPVDTPSSLHNSDHPNHAAIRTQSSSTEHAERESCIKRGGQWMDDRRAGFLKKNGCNEPTSDKGKQCNDSSECESACVNDRTSPTGGRCHAYHLFFGCGKRVASGGHVAILCID